MRRKQIASYGTKSRVSRSLGGLDPRNHRNPQGDLPTELLVESPLGFDGQKLVLKPGRKIADATDATATQTINSLLASLRDAGLIEG